MISTRSERVSFIGSQGEFLDARLDGPVHQPVAYALFAHCFTCSKQYLAISRISRELAERGIAVLRFDFTGLGNSAGDFANTNFSSNVADIKYAADFLRNEFQAPHLLIGHSLGGAAVLAVANLIPEVEGVITIAAPSDPAHIKEHLSHALPEIERQGELEVSIAGRPFRIQSQFLDDIATHKLDDAIRQLDAALLVFHSPVDRVVDIGHAERIFTLASYPKSFISLEGADHLLTNRADAEYMARLLTAWVIRYIPSITQDGKLIPEGTVVVNESERGRYAQEIRMGRHMIRSDEPVKDDGNDTGGSPYDLLLASLGACTSMTLRMYANHKKLSLKRVEVTLQHEKIHAKDCQDCESDTGKIDRIRRIIDIQGDLTDAQRHRILEIADRCPVHRTLYGEIKVDTELLEKP